MIELLNESVLWWHWAVFGLVLFAVEMISGTFILLGFGLAAILISIIYIIFEISFNTQLTLWIIFCIISIGAWIKWFKEKTLTQSGQSNYRLDTLGTVVKTITPHDRGKVTFDTPVLGNTTWTATSKIEIPQGSRVKIVQINGQLIEVKEIK